MNMSSSSEAFLTVHRLSQAYNHKKILREISFEIRRAEITILLGPNGAGKTTLIKVLAGLLKPLGGEIQWNSHLKKTNLYLPSGFLYNELTLKENLAFYRRLYGTSNEHAEKIIQIFSIGDFYNEKVGELSHGQRVRGALCRTFLMESALYFLDEPFSGLDDGSAQRLLDLLEKIKGEGKSILLSTHEPHHVESLCDRWLQIKKGEIAWDNAKKPQ